jgi:hypothetical protein
MNRLKVVFKVLHVIKVVLDPLNVLGGFMPFARNKNEVTCSGLLAG